MNRKDYTTARTVGWLDGRSLRALIFILGITILGCQSPESAWQEARSVDTEQAYKEFLAKFENSDFSEPAHARLTYLQDWNEALAEDSSSAYVAFLKRYPRAEHLEEAEYRRDFRKAVETDSFEAFVNFLSTHPEPITSEGIWEEAESAAWQRALEANRPEPFSRLAVAIPQSRLAEEAASRAEILKIEVIEFAKATSNCSDSADLTGVILKLISRWPDVSIGIGAADVKGLLRGGGTVDLAWILPLDERGSDWKAPRGGRMCGGGASTSIGKSLPRWGYIGENAILPIEDYALEVHFAEKGSSIELGLLFEVAPEQIKGLEFLDAHTVSLSKNRT